MHRQSVYDYDLKVRLNVNQNKLESSAKIIMNRCTKYDIVLMLFYCMFDDYMRKL